MEIEKEFNPETMTLATPEDVFRMWRKLCRKEDEMNFDPNTKAREEADTTEESIIQLAKICAILSNIEEDTRDTEGIDGMNAFVIRRFEEIWDFAAKNWNAIEFYRLVDSEIKRLKFVA